MATWHQQQNQRSVFAAMYAPEKGKAKVVTNKPGEMASVMSFSGDDCDEQAQGYFNRLTEKGHKGLFVVLSKKGE